MDYILTLNQKIRSFEKYYAETPEVANKIFTISSELLNSLYSGQVIPSVINNKIKELQNELVKYNAINKKYHLLEGELKDISVRIKNDYPDTDPKEIVDVDRIKGKYYTDLDNKIETCSKLLKTLEFLNDILEVDIVKDIDLSYVELIEGLSKIVKDFLPLLTEDKQMDINNTYLSEKEFDKDDLYLLEPTKNEPKEEKKHLAKTRRIIIEARDYNQSIKDYEEYLKEKYESVGYKVEYEGKKRKPYPHELKQSYFINNNGEKVDIAKSYAEDDYYETTYLPYISQKDIKIDDMVSTIKDIKNNIYETIARNIISKEKKISEEYYRDILNYLLDTKYQLDNYVTYDVSFLEGEYYLNIYFNKEKITIILEYEELLEVYKKIYQEILPVYPVFNPNTVQHADTTSTTVYSDATGNKEMKPEDRKRIIKAYINNKVRSKKWPSGAQYSPFGAVPEELNIKFYANSTEYNIDLERAGIQIVL